MPRVPRPFPYRISENPPLDHGPQQPDLRGCSKHQRLKICSGHQATSLLLGREGPQTTAWRAISKPPNNKCPAPAPAREPPSLPVSSLLSSTGVRDILQDQNQGGRESRQVTEGAASDERRAVGGGTGQGGGSLATLRPTPDGAVRE